MNIYIHVTDSSDSLVNIIISLDASVSTRESVQKKFQRPFSWKQTVHCTVNH